jgi:hypothetical protein
MTTKPNQPDAAIDKTLAALNAASPPEGMQARIAARIAAQSAPATSPWRAAFSPAWWRGAATGAAAAMLVTGVVLFASHNAQPRSDAGRATPRGASAVRTLAPVSAPAQNAPAGQALGNPCASPKVLQLRNATFRASNTLRAETAAAIGVPSHPAPVRPLTAQERALVELARTADPKMLVALSPETQAKVEAQEQDNFNKFFAPPPAPPQPVDRQPATQPNQSQSQL